MDATKVYVTVCTEITAEGQMVPCSIEWEDGRLYPIDKVLDITQAAARRAGGQGDRYTVRIGHTVTYLFFERSTDLTGPVIGRWFVERKSGNTDSTAP